jgi:inhibitor of cysteine peptidase
MRVYRDPSIPIEVTVGQGFAISLEAIPSTGYTWQAEYDPAMVDLLKPPKFVPDSSAIGGGGVETFEFQAKQLGETQLKMKYQREWETDAREIKLFRVHITQ